MEYQVVSKSFIWEIPYFVDELDGDEAFVDADVEAMQAIAHTVDDEPELSEAGRVRSDFVSSDTRYRPY